MQPTFHHLALAREGLAPRGPNQLDEPSRVSRSLSGVRRLRSDESWIEISSQPSSSSVSSVAPEDVDSNGLGVQRNRHVRRRRRLTANPTVSPAVPIRRSSVAGSSQEEYEESESESDRIMSSSNENIEAQLSEGISPPVLTSSVSEEASSNNAKDDDDENATALGVITHEPAFTPQPNAFSHPPQSHNTRHTRSLETRPSYFPAHRTSPHRRQAPRSSSSRGPRSSHTPYNMIAPTHQADHDAALRASLSTLLSCAAAARGLPKRESQTIQQSPDPQSNRIEPSTLRLVPGSAIPTEEQAPHLPPGPPIRHRTSAASLSSNDKGKRKASTSKDRRSKKRRGNSPNRETGVAQVSPTLMTWVVSAGVVVLFSAISFSAGYAIGKEVGRWEAGAAGGEGVVCGKEVGRGLRRLRWGGGSGSGSVIRV